LSMTPLNGGELDKAFVAARRFGHVVSSLGWGTHALAPLSFRAATYSGIFTLLPLLTGEGRASRRDTFRGDAPGRSRTAFTVARCDADSR
jgi:NADPH2:quinone reductase